MVKYIGKELGYLERLQKKQDSIVVGIWGVHSGAGVTTMTVALANYLTGFLGKRVAVFECGNKFEFSKIYESIGGQKEQKEEGVFSYENVTYYMKGTTNIQKLLGKEFDMIIVDFGTSALVPSEFMRCKYKIVLSSMQPWFCGRYHEFCEKLENYQGSDVWLHIIGSDVKEVKRIRRKYKVVAVERPNINNAYVIDKGLINFFQSLF